MLKGTTKPLWRRVLIQEGLAKSSKKKHLENTSGIFVKQVVFHAVNHCGPLPLKELHSTGETIVWRDPGGSWACLPPVYIWVWNHPATGCDMCTTPERRETLGNANQNKTTKRAGYKKVYEKNPKGKHSELKEPDETLDKTKTLTIIARQKKAKEKAIKWSIQTGKEPYRNQSEKNRAYKMLKGTPKPLRRRVLIEESLDKSSKKKHSENIDKWHLCKAGSFSCGESPQTPALEGTSLHRWNNSVERPWGILSLFTTCLHLCVKSPCHRLWHVDYPSKSTLRGEKH